MISKKRQTGYFFIISALILFFGIYYISLSYPGYNQITNTLSDLGNNIATANTFNTFALAFSIIFILGLIYYRKQISNRSITILSFLTADGLAGIALYPLDTGGIHSVFALLGFASSVLVMYTYGRRHRHNIIVSFSYIGAVALLVFFLGITTGINGLLERLIFYPYIIFLILFGYKLVKE